MTKQSKNYYIYILTNKSNTVLYVGVTRDLIKRVFEHKSKVVESFTKKYNVTKLVYYEMFDNPENAILREKQLKAGSRQRKLNLIDEKNPEWSDLYRGLI